MVLTLGHPVQALGDRKAGILTIELTIHGRGGQGGVTLAKLIANAYFLRGKFVQAFGVYAAERSGAPLQAFVRIDDEDISNHNQVYEPDHVIVIDRALIGPHVLKGLKPGGCLILNTPEPPDAFEEWFAGWQVATVDATDAAIRHGLGTRTVPIVNTTMLGAAANVLGLTLDDVDAALSAVKFGGGNVEAAHEAFGAVETAVLKGEPKSSDAPAVRSAHVAGLLDESVGGLPEIQTGSWASRRPYRHTLTPPCNHGCPAGNDVRGFIEAVASEDHDEALAILLETSPLPAVCGRVCPAPCAEACNRSELDESVNIPELERAVGDRGTWPAPTMPHRDESIAVIGSGPAGLATTYHLAKLGYPVTIFESDDELGGVLRTGIPEYRLPRHVLDQEIGHIIAHGVTARTGRLVTREALLDLTHTYSAVFVGTGLQKNRSVDLGPKSRDVVSQGIAFLDQVRRRRIARDALNGAYVVVVGGGNTAMDAARSARRLGAHVHVIYRRTRDQMPAIKEEIEDALAEGIVLDELVSPVRLRSDSVGPLLTCVRMRLGDPDASGRPAPVEETTDDAYFDIRCDKVILAVGQSSDLSILPEGSEVREGDTLLGLTGGPVFAGGDFASNEGTVAAAIGSGRKAAWHIHRTLTGEDLFPPADPPLAEPDVITTQIFSRSPSAQSETVAPEVRRRSFVEVRRGLDTDGSASTAVAEARRCFSCGVCNNCDRCVTHCPEAVLVREGDEFRFDYDYCKGCGICSSECPRGVVYMDEI
jgi:2-oxoacid:acceptor oxidoreductase gamma subunit (pyruvate/2-ketoisovalerate family)